MVAFINVVGEPNLNCSSSNKLCGHRIAMCDFLAGSIFYSYSQEPTSDYIET